MLKKKKKIVGFYSAKYGMLKFQVPAFRSNDHFQVLGYNEKRKNNLMEIKAVDAIQCQIGINGDRSFYFGGQDDKWDQEGYNTWLFEISTTLHELNESKRKGLLNLIIGCMMINYLIHKIE
ncbi:MAG: hypothetical protein GY755_22145 [Chloroflexi bacterium]|nr:hypothetical protein [Chloroflexota bacterium]